MNAYTTKEYTCYYTRTLDENFYEALDIMADMFLESLFAEKDIEKEKGVIVQEINMYEDAPDELVHDILQNGILSGSSLGMPILGTESTISNFTSKSMREFYEKNYHTENTVISVAGNFKTEEMLEKLNKTLGQWNSKKPYTPYNTVGSYKVNQMVREKEIEQLHLCLSFPALSREDPMRYALGIFNTIFGGGMSSKLFQKIREEHGLTYSIYSYPTAFSDVGMFSVYAGMSPNQLEKALELIAGEIEIMKHRPLSKELVQATKDQMISNYLIGAESTINRMNASGVSLLLKNEILTADEVIDQVKKVTSQDILNTLQKVFVEDQMSWCGVGKVNQKQMEGSIKKVFS